MITQGLINFEINCKLKYILFWYILGVTVYGNYLKIQQKKALQSWIKLKKLQVTSVLFE